MKSDRTILITFGKKVRMLRQERKLSQEQLAFKAGFHRTYIGMIERAERNITLANLNKLANALEINLKDFFD